MTPNTPDGRGVGRVDGRRTGGGSLERVEVRRPPEIAAEIFDVRNSTRLWRVYHETYDLCLVPVAGNDPAGASHWWYRGRMHQTRRGSLMLTEPGEMHVTRRVEAPASHFWIVQIESSAVIDAAQELGATTAHLREAATDAPHLYRALSMLCDSVFGSGAGEVLPRETAFVTSVRALIGECGESRPAPPALASRRQLETARELIHARFTEQVRLDELAAAAGLSRYHLAHEFKRAFGVPPHLYQNALRAAEAMRQLRAGVPAALVDVGFADQSHLTRHFKRAYGLTPGEYAAAVLVNRRRG